MKKVIERAKKNKNKKRFNKYVESTRPSSDGRVIVLEL